MTIDVVTVHKDYMVGESSESCSESMFIFHINLKIETADDFRSKNNT